VQHEDDSLGRSERFEHDEHCQPDRIGDQGLLLGVSRVVRGDDRVR
jgi:hypothetical protein